LDAMSLRFSSRGLFLTSTLLGLVLSGFLWFDMACGGDTIHFKDGMRTVCHGKAWEEKDEVHCEYDGGLLIYPKKDVSRIEKGPSAKPEAEPAKAPDTGVNPLPAPAATASPPPKRLSPSPAQPHAGVLFYDPRRPKKYWSSPTARHDSYPEAVAALAAEFERPVQWIEQNIPESNDLEAIRATLTARAQTPAPLPTRSAEPAASTGVEFYNPRRPQKYWSAPDARHDTYEQAVEALAREFERPVAWVERHMGDANDLDLIRQALRNAQASKETP
jgi:hypothetical protein